jgi:Na+/proline symporter
MTWMLIAGAVALVVSVLLTRRVGRALRGRPRWLYWAANATVAVVALALLMASSIIPSRPLWGVGLGLGFGGLAGLRYGFKDLFSVRTGDPS